MEMTGEQRIPADIETVWAALNDADILRASIPGCQELIKSSDTEMTAVAVVKVGPIAARFQGKVTLSDLDPPNGYRIAGEGQGGVAGHAKGGALVKLVADGDETVLHYEVSAQVGGRLAQLGGRMIDATARSISATFFKKFAQEITQRQSGEPEATGPSAAVPVEAVQRAAAAAFNPATASGGSGLPAWLWTVCGLLAGMLFAAVLGFPQVGQGRFSADTLLWIALLLALLLGYTLGRQASSSR